MYLCDLRVAEMASGCWRRTVSSHDGCGLLQGILCERQNAMHLVSIHRREPLQKLVDRRALVEVFEKRDNGHVRAREAPNATELGGVPIHRATEGPIHTLSLPLVVRGG